MMALNVLILIWFIFAGTDVAVTKYPAYICSAGHQFCKNVLSLQDGNAKCLPLLEEFNGVYWNRTERKFLCTPMYPYERYIP
jgi:hypothetical protein